MSVIFFWVLTTNKSLPDVSAMKCCSLSKKNERMFTGKPPVISKRFSNLLLKKDQQYVIETLGKFYLVVKQRYNRLK